MCGLGKDGPAHKKRSRVSTTTLSPNQCSGKLSIQMYSTTHPGTMQAFFPKKRKMPSIRSIWPLVRLMPQPQQRGTGLAANLLGGAPVGQALQQGACLRDGGVLQDG